MYKLLLVTDREDLRTQFGDQIDWAKLNCRVPYMASSPQEAIDLLNSKAIDAVGYRFFSTDGMQLTKFLRYGRPSLPIFQVCDTAEKQTEMLAQTVSVLNRLRADYADSYYDEETMLTLQRDALIHSLLAGEMRDWDSVMREMKLIRAHVSLDKPCVLYEIDMPQGEVYLSEHSGRYVEGIYYAVAVLPPRHTRVVCMPMHGQAPETRENFGKRTDEHINDSIQKIKEYLDLDMNVSQSAWLDSVKDLLGEE